MSPPLRGPEAPRAVGRCRPAPSASGIAVVIVLGLLSAAPTAGDVGGCGVEATLLDTESFALARKEEDCRRCTECAIRSARCERACDEGAAPETSVPETCRPLLHDGEVCLRALRAASCGAYTSYVSDVAPSTPSECAFCKIAPPEPPPSFAADATAPAEAARAVARRRGTAP